MKLGELGNVSFGILNLIELGEVSFGILNLIELGEVSFGMLKLGEGSVGIFEVRRRERWNF